MLARVGIQLSPHFSHWDNSFRGSINFFHLKIALGWLWANLGRCLRKDRKTLMSTKACFCGKAFLKQTCRIYPRRKQGSIWTHGSNLNCTTILLRQPWEELVPWERKGCLSLHSCKLQCWPMLARNDTYWRVLAFSFLHISFIGGSIKFFHLKIALGLALGKSWPLLAQGQKNTHVHKGMLLWELSKPAKITFGENKDLSELMDQI